MCVCVFRVHTEVYRCRYTCRYIDIYRKRASVMHMQVLVRARIQRSDLTIPCVCMYICLHDGPVLRMNFGLGNTRAMRPHEIMTVVRIADDRMAYQISYRSGPLLCAVWRMRNELAKQKRIDIVTERFDRA